MNDATDRNGAAYWRQAFNLRRRSYQLWFLLLTGALICIAALIADAASASFEGAGTIVPVVFSGMCACAGVYTFRKESGDRPSPLRGYGPAATDPAFAAAAGEASTFAKASAGRSKALAGGSRDIRAGGRS